MLNNKFPNKNCKCQKPSPFDYNTPGKYLISAYHYQKIIEPGLSQRYLAVKMGYKSASAFQDIIKGRVFPDKMALNALQNAFNLNEKESIYLALLFVIQNIHDPFYKEIIFSQIKLLQEA